jgi:hypothetical protein
MVARVLAVAQHPNRPMYRLETNGRFPRGCRCSGAPLLSVLLWEPYRHQGRDLSRTVL